MSSEWRTFRLHEAGRLVTGKTPKSGLPEYEGTDVPFVSPPDFSGNKWISKTTRTISEVGAQSVKGSLIPPRSVLVTCIGSDMGKAAIAAARCVTNQQINAVLVDDSKFCPEFLYYNLSLRKDEIRGLAGGSAQPILNKSAFGLISFDAPPIDEQKQISAALRPLDDRITLLRETNATLEAIAQALFKSWFVDFDPLRAKMEGRAPEGMDDATAALFPDGFEDSALGTIPQGWLAGKLGNLLVERTERVGLENAVVLSAIQTGHLVRSVDHFNKRVHSEDIKKYKRVPPMSFAYNPSRLNIGSIGINEIGVTGAVSPIYVVIEPKSVSGGYFLWHQLRTDQIKKWISTLSSGTVRQSVSFSDFSTIPLVIPPELLLEKYHSLRKPLSLIQFRFDPERWIEELFSSWPKC